MKTYERYNISVGQIYSPASGGNSTVEVLDVETYADCDDVVVLCSVRNIEYRIDCFKLSMVRYFLVT